MKPLKNQHLRSLREFLMIGQELGLPQLTLVLEGHVKRTSLGSKVLSMAQLSESEICKSINTATQELGSRALCHMMRLTQLRTSKRSSADTGIQKPIDLDIQARLSKPKLAQLIKKNQLGLAKLILHLQALTKTGQVKSGLMRPSKRISPWLNSQTLLICFSLTLI